MFVNPCKVKENIKKFSNVDLLKNYVWNNKKNNFRYFLRIKKKITISTFWHESKCSFAESLI